MSELSTEELVAAALQVRRHAYVPYSNYRVGAALLTTDGLIVTGCNVENASYPAGICAERAALVKAVSEGHRTFDALVVVTDNGEAPCGICRQMLYEFAPTLHVMLVDGDGRLVREMPLSDLLPHGFGPASLNY